MRLIDGDALLSELKAKPIVSGTAKAAAMDLVRAAPTIGGWISVKDRLPEKETEYICWFGDYPLGAFAMVCRWNKIKGAFWCYSDNAKWAFVTHWMPLPEPPKEDTDGDPD